LGKNKVIKSHGDQMRLTQKKKKKNIGVLRDTPIVLLKHKKKKKKKKKIKNRDCGWYFLDMCFRFIVLLVDGKCHREFSS
jgi:hypothetical protein